MSRMNQSVRTCTVRVLTICLVYEFVTWFIEGIISGFLQYLRLSCTVFARKMFLTLKHPMVTLLSTILARPADDSGSLAALGHVTQHAIHKVIYFEPRSFSCFIFHVCFHLVNLSLQAFYSFVGNALYIFFVILT